MPKRITFEELKLAMPLQTRWVEIGGCSEGGNEVFHVKGFGVATNDHTIHFRINEGAEPNPEAHFRDWHISLGKDDQVAVFGTVVILATSDLHGNPVGRTFVPARVAYDMGLCVTACDGPPSVFAQIGLDMTDERVSEMSSRQMIRNAVKCLQGMTPQDIDVFVQFLVHAAPEEGFKIASGCLLANDNDGPDAEIWSVYQHLAGALNGLINGRIK